VTRGDKKITTPPFVCMNVELVPGGKGDAYDVSVTKRDFHITLGWACSKLETDGQLLNVGTE